MGPVDLFVPKRMKKSLDQQCDSNASLWSMAKLVKLLRRLNVPGEEVSHCLMTGEIAAMKPIGIGCIVVAVGPQHNWL